MEFKLSPEQKLIRETARELSRREMLPKAAEIDRSHRFPKELFNRMAELGLLGVMVPEQWGGGGMDALSYALAMEEIAPRVRLDGGRSCRSITRWSCDPILTEGTDAQRAGWLPDWRAARSSAASPSPSPRPAPTPPRRGPAPSATAPAG